MKLKKFATIILIIIFVVFLVRYLLYHQLYRLEYKDVIMKYSAEFNVDEYLVMSIINAESRYNKYAISPQGATGLMQITKPTAEWIAHSMGDEKFVLNDLYDPEINIKMGIWYINNLSKEFSSKELFLAAYNAGRGHVNDWLDESIISIDGKDADNIPFKETANYVKKVIVYEKIYRILY